MEFPECTYTGGMLTEDGLIYLSAISDQLAEEMIDHTALIRISSNECKYRTFPNSFASFVRNKLSGDQYFVTIDGLIYSVEGSKDARCEIDSSSDGPSDLVHIKSLAEIEGRYFVAGMARHVYSTADITERWTAIDDEIFVGRDERSEPVGILSIDGFRLDDVYACGLNGEIHHYDGVKWVKEESITNLAITQLLCCPDDKVLAVGQAGLIMKGCQGIWESVHQDLTTSDFWGVCWFKGFAYLSNYDGVFVYRDGEVQKIELPSKLTTAYLASSCESIISIGHKHVAQSIDGEIWDEISVDVSSGY